ncbi:hypothetical protein ACFSTC_05835 [Nonomuraea ferruginea]
MLPNGKLGVLDFGAVNRGGYPLAFGQLTRIFNQGDMDTVIAGLRAEGFIRPDIEIDPDALRAFLSPYVEPTAVEEFTFSRAWLQTQAASATDLRPGNVVRQLNLLGLVRAHPPGSHGGDRGPVPAGHHGTLSRRGDPLGSGLLRRHHRPRRHGPCRHLISAPAPPGQVRTGVSPRIGGTRVSRGMNARSSSVGGTGSLPADIPGLRSEHEYAPQPSARSRTGHTRPSGR